MDLFPQSRHFEKNRGDQGGKAIETLSLIHIFALMIPSYIEVFGKNSVEDVWKEKAETVVKYACYQAYTAAAAPKILEERLAERGMDRLYRDMELPLVFTLADMETCLLYTSCVSWMQRSEMLYRFCIIKIF